MSIIPRIVLPARPIVTMAHSETSDVAELLEAFDEPAVVPIPSSMLVSVVKLHEAAVVHVGTCLVEK